MEGNYPFSETVDKKRSKVLTFQIECGERMQDADFLEILKSVGFHPEFEFGAEFTIEILRGKEMQLSVAQNATMQVPNEGCIFQRF